MNVSWCGCATCVQHKDTVPPPRTDELESAIAAERARADALQARCDEMRAALERIANTNADGAIDGHAGDLINLIGQKARHVLAAPAPPEPSAQDEGEEVETALRNYCRHVIETASRYISDHPVVPGLPEPSAVATCFCGQPATSPSRGCVAHRNMTVDGSHCINPALNASGTLLSARSYKHQWCETEGCVVSAGHTVDHLSADEISPATGTKPKTRCATCHHYERSHGSNGCVVERCCCPGWLPTAVAGDAPGEGGGT